MNRRESLKFAGAGLGFLLTGIPALAKKEDRFPKGSRVKLVNLEGLDLKLVGRCGTVKDYDEEFEWIGVQLDGRHWIDWFNPNEIQTID